MPTGLSDPGEDITTAAVREVREETGLHCIFEEIICIRQAHPGGGSTSASASSSSVVPHHSDLFFVCLLRLDSQYYEEDNSIPLHAQEDEIAQLQWMEIEDYATQKLWIGSPLYEEMNNALRRRADVEAHRRRRGETHNSTSSVAGVTMPPAPTSTPSCSNAIVDCERRDDVSSSNSKEAGTPCGFIAKTLPVGFRPGTNTIYVSKL